jgi:GGDEF domain-containing protein
VINPFKKSNSDNEAAETYLRTSQLLLQSIGLHAVEGEREEYESFRAAIAQLQPKFDETKPLREALIAVGAASKGMHEYGRRTTRFIRAQCEEFQAVVRMLTAAIADLAPIRVDASELQDLNWIIGKTSTVEEIRDLKKRLSEYIQAVRQEVVENGKAAELTTETGSELEKTTADPTAAALREQYPSTELPSRTQSETAIRKSIQSGKRCCAVIFSIDRFSHIRSRFGPAISDQIVTLFTQRLTSELAARDRLFRWGDSSLLVLLEGRDSEDEVRREIGRALFRRFEETFTIRNRPIILPISATWLVITLFGQSCDQVVSKLDSFVAQSFGAATGGTKTAA